MGGIKFPALQAALKSHYGAQSTLQLPLSGQRFPIKDVSLTISDKSEQDQREKARQLAEEKAKEPKRKKVLKKRKKLRAIKKINAKKTPFGPRGFA